MYLAGLFKKIIIKLLSPVIREIVEMEVQRIIHVEPPKLKEIKIASIQKGSKITVWDALVNDPSQISFCVTWIDTNGLEDFRSYRCKDVSELRHLLDNVPKPFNKFSSISLHVVPIGSTKSIIETLVDGGHHMPTNEMNKLTIPLIKWIDQRPELLI